MTNTKNVWENIHSSSSRRISAEYPHDFFWVCDAKGRYGLRINLHYTLTTKDFIDQIHGITILKNNTDPKLTELYLFLNDNNNWQIFYSLCTDLLQTSKNVNTSKDLVNNLQRRIKCWLLFLSKKNSLTLSQAQQMGLLTELLCLKSIILSNLPYRDAILSWVGPNFDRQDFSLTSFFLEVKSFISSKGAIVTISSLHQLVNNIKPLYLVAYGISENNNGVTIKDVADEIYAIIGTDNENSELFEQKLAEYGFINDVTQEPFFKYIIDNVTCYAVIEDFPKLVPNEVHEQIISVQYKLDLTKCVRFEKNLNTLIN